MNRFENDSLQCSLTRFRRGDFRQYCQVFFRNSHFNTILKYDGVSLSFEKLSSLRSKGTSIFFAQR